MADFNLAPLFQPQLINVAGAALTFAPVGGTVVPANTQYRILTLWVVNVTTLPVTLKIWRIPSGSTPVDANIVVPIGVIVPPGTNTFAAFPVSTLWGAVLQPGDSIQAIAGTANALTISGDGGIII